ncbi:MAG: hypothetical protein R3B09_25615 [Nannocystaceae bacterium]
MLPYRLALIARAAAPLALALALPACSGSGPEDPPPTMTFTEYREAYEQALCEWRVGCKLEESLEKCREWTFLDREGSYTEAALEKGTLLFHGDLAQGCLDELKALSCLREDPTGTPTCLDVLEGQVAPEEPCMLSAECALDGVCGKDPSCVDMCCAGECRVLPGPLKIGEDCTNPTRTCEDGSFCQVDPITFQLTVCAPKVGLGGSCAFDGSAACSDDTYCRFDTGLCTARIPEGADCYNYSDACTAPAVCVYFGDYPNYNASCRSPAALGAPCSVELYNRACLDLGAVCNPGTGVCEDGPEIGAPCVDSRCGGAAYCDYETNVCRGYAALGTPCGYLNGDVACGGALQCDNDVCTAPSYLEDACPVPGQPYTAEQGEG